MADKFTITCQTQLLLRCLVEAFNVRILKPCLGRDVNKQCYAWLVVSATHQEVRSVKSQTNFLRSYLVCIRLWSLETKSIISVMTNVYPALTKFFPHWKVLHLLIHLILTRNLKDETKPRESQRICTKLAASEDSDSSARL